jgi:hypothetical protein
MCGYNFVNESAADTPPAVLPTSSAEARLSIGSGFRFGLGFMSAVVVFWLLFVLIFLGSMGAIFGALFRGLPR